MVLTGLRRWELATLTEHDLSLENPNAAFLTVPSGNAKNRTEADMPVRSDLAVELIEFMA